LVDKKRRGLLVDKKTKTKKIQSPNQPDDDDYEGSATWQCKGGEFVGEGGTCIGVPVCPCYGHPRYCTLGT
jgi:hypothetical protein